MSLEYSFYLLAVATCLFAVAMVAQTRCETMRIAMPKTGMANAIAGSGVILGLASLMGIPLGIGAGIYLAEYARGTWFVGPTTAFFFLSVYEALKKNKVLKLHY